MAKAELLPHSGGLMEGQRPPVGATQTSAKLRCRVDNVCWLASTDSATMWEACSHVQYRCPARVEHVLKTCCAIPGL